MRVEIEKLDTRGVSLDLDASSADVDQKIRVREAVGLSGVYEQLGQLTRIDQLSADRLVLDALALVFGTVVMREQGSAVFQEVRATYQKDAEHLALDVASPSLHAGSLSFDVGSVHVHGETTMRDAHLWVRDKEGRVDASHLTISGLCVRIGELSMAAPLLTAERVHVSWGEDGFRLEAVLVDAPNAEASAGSLQLRGEGLRLRTFRVHRAEVAFASAELTSAEVDLAFDDAEDNAAKEPVQTDPRAPDEAPGLLDLALLDGLSGVLNVDAEVDVGVPVIKHRRATHRLRLDIDDGRIDYRQLESGLSTLEESLLDFSVRSASNSLVLELAVPLLPTRGHGKPLLVWDLSQADLTLAEDGKVRLSLLPEYRLAGRERTSEPAPDPESTSRFSLRRLDLESIDVGLVLRASEEPRRGPIRWLGFESLRAQGAVHHDARDGASVQAGRIEGEIQQLDLRLTELPLGGSTLDLSRLQLSALSNVSVDFCGLKRTRLRAQLQQLVLGVLHFR